MAEVSGQLIWKEKIYFEISNQNVKSAIDATLDHGGDHLAPTPKELVLNAMMGCTAMDVLALLKKMRFTFSEFKMTAHAPQTETHPIHFPKVQLSYYIVSNETEDHKLIKAVDLSMTKYCGVNYMLSKACPVFFDVYLNDKKIHFGEAFKN